MREIIGNTTATPNPRPDWNQVDETKADYIKNKPDVDAKYDKSGGEITGDVVISGNLDVRDPQKNTSAVNRGYVDKANKILQDKIDVYGQVLLSNNLLCKANTTDTYHSRQTAGGANIIDGSYAVLKKVEGNTVKCNNLLDPTKVEDKGDGYTYNSETYEFYIKSTLDYWFGHEGKELYKYKFKENTQYTLSCDLKIEQADASIYFIFAYTDGTFSGNEEKLIQATEYTYATFTSSVDKTVAFIALRHDKDCSMYFKNARLNEGAVDLGYQPYFDGLKSASFSGIKSTGKNSKEESEMSCTKTELRIGDSIDFEKGIITKNSRMIVLDGSEDERWTLDVGSLNADGTLNDYFRHPTCYVTALINAESEKHDKAVLSRGFFRNDNWTDGCCRIGVGNQIFYWVGAINYLGLRTWPSSPVDGQTNAQLLADAEGKKLDALAAFKANLAEHPLIIVYNPTHPEINTEELYKHIMQYTINGDDASQCGAKITQCFYSYSKDSKQLVPAFRSNEMGNVTYVYSGVYQYSSSIYDRWIAISKDADWNASEYDRTYALTDRLVDESKGEFLYSSFEEPFDCDSNEYIAYLGGTETVLGNDNSEYVNNTLTQNYICSMEGKS